MKHFTLIVSMLFWPACFADGLPSSVSQTVLTVRVENGTKNGSEITGDAVTVDVYEHREFVLSIDGIVDANGQAVFEHVPAPVHAVFVVRVKHQDMMFRGRAVGLGSGKDNAFAIVRVFDVSDDNSKLTVPIHHIIVKASSGTLGITEYIQLKNPSDMAVRSKEVDSQGRPIVLKVMLPEGFSNFESSGYLEKSALVFTQEGFYDTMAVPPGEYPVKFSYTLDIDSATMDIVKKLTIGVSSLVVFTDLGQVTLQGLGEPNLVTEASGAQMKYYKLDNLAVSEEVSFTLAGFNVNRFDVTSWLILAVVIGAVVILVFFRLRPEKAAVTQKR